MKKTLIITLEYPPQIGGIASYVYNFVSHLPAEAVVVVAPPMKGDRVFDQANSWKTFRLKPYWFLWPHWLRLFFSVRKLVRQERVEDVAVHHVLPLGHIAYFLRKFKVIKSYTIFLHGTDVELATQKKSKRRKLLRLCSQAEQVVVNSEFLKDKLLGRLETTLPVTVVYPCPGDAFLQTVPPADIAALKSRLALSGKKVLLTVGRMVEGKGFPHLIRLLPSILASVPNTVLILVGTGPKEKELIEQVQKNNLQNAVRFLGDVPPEELPLIYQAADIFVLLTHPDEGREEGLGMVFLEAAASGLPVVAGRVGGVAEAVEHLQTGIIVDVNEDKAVVRALIDLLKQESYAKQMGQAGKERIRQEFRWDKQIEKMGMDDQPQQ